jgi:hypothetical protein
MVSIAITTAPRPYPTLSLALASLRRAGCIDPVLVVADGDPTLQVDIRCAVRRLPHRCGIVETWARALEALLVETTAPWLMVLQDDVTWPERSWLRALEALSAIAAHDPAFGYASLHTMPRVQAALLAVESSPVVASWHSTGWLQPHLAKRRWCGAQCWTFPRASAEALLADPSFRAYAAVATRGFDHEVTSTLHRLGRQTYTWWPSLLSHDLGKGNRAPRCRKVAP